jgi:predicted nucleotidyltransferase component of viral defense system
MSPAHDGLAHSVQARLLNHSRMLGADPNSVLTRYGLERFLYRLGRSAHAERFILKGGMLLRVWLGETSRPTRDADLLGHGSLSSADLERIFRELCVVEVEPDGVSYVPESVQVSAIRVEDAYGGQRITLTGLLGKARLSVQVDVGIGDVVTPAAEWIDYPSLLDLPRPHLRAYRPETTIAEKVHAMVTLGIANTRMRDFFDVYELARLHEFDGATLASAVRDTFARRGTDIGAWLPLALTPAFSADAEKQVQWRAFLRKGRLDRAPQELAAVCDAIAAFLGPVLMAAGAAANPGHWSAGGPWI